MNLYPNRRLPLLLIGFSLTLNSVLRADDWKQYRGNEGDGKSTETTAAVDWSEGLGELRWKVPTPLGFSSFSIADSRCYTLVAREDAEGTKREVLVALSVDDGSELWSAVLGESDYGHDGGNSGASDNRGGDGPRSTPVADGKHVYVYDSHMVLGCYSAATGELVWQHDIVNDFNGREIKWLSAASPVLSGDRVFVAGGGQGETFLAFDKSTGELIWKSGDETTTHATPTLATIDKKPQVIHFVQSGLISLDQSSGEELWRASFPFSVSTAASPVVDGNLVYCSAGYGVGAGLFKTGEGSEAEEIWFKSNELMNHWSTPLVHDGHLYGIYEFKKYGRAPLQCIDLKTGEIVWEHRGFGPGNCILVDDKLVVLSDAGEVAVVEASSEGYRELARSQVLNGKCWSTPAYSDGKIYVRSTEEAACLELSK